MQADISMGRMKSEPHDFYIGVVLSSKEHVASISSDDIFINSELDLPPELAVLLWTHGQPVEGDAEAEEINRCEKDER